MAWNFFCVAGPLPVGEIQWWPMDSPHKGLEKHSFIIFFDLCQNKWLYCQWFERLWCSSDITVMMQYLLDFILLNTKHSSDTYVCIVHLDSLKINFTNSKVSFYHITFNTYFKPWVQLSTSISLHHTSFNSLPIYALFVRPSDDLIYSDIHAHLLCQS